MEAFGGAAEVELLGDGDEVAQLLQVHGCFLSYTCLI
jgi:hypothetical protein